MSIPNRFDIVQAVNAANPTLIQRNTRKTCTEFIWRVVDALSRTDANFGFLSKSPAENHVEIPGAGLVSIDAVAYRHEVPTVDIIGSAGDGPGTGSIGWNEDDERRPSNLWVPAVPYPNGPPEPPEPPPPPPPDLRAEIDALRADVAGLRTQLQTTNEVATGAYLRAETTNVAIERLTDRLNGGLRVRGEVDLPVVVSGFRARAKGDIDVKVTG